MTVLVTACLLGITTGTAAADPSEEPSEPTPGERLCSVSDPGLAELSGLAANGEDGYYAVPDGEWADGGLNVYELDDKCEVTATNAVYNNGVYADPLDPEDMAVDSEGTVWVADIGDNDKERPRIALWKIDPDSWNAELYRLIYPDGAVDAEAFLIQPDGTPLVITKEANKAVLYEPTGDLTEEGTDMENVGEFPLEHTDSVGGPLGAAGQIIATGAALSPEGDKVVIRTYTDAYEFDVADGDVVAAITGSTPRVTPLIGEGDGEAMGEAITFGAEGDFITGSEAGGGDEAVLWKYTPAAPADTSANGSGDDGGDGRSFFDKLTLNQIIMIIAAFGVVGMGLAIVGAVVIVKARKRRKEQAQASADAPDPDDLPGRGDRAAFRSGGYREDDFEPPAPYDDRDRGYGDEPESGYGPPARGARYEPDLRDRYDAPPPYEDDPYGPAPAAPSPAPRPDRGNSYGGEHGGGGYGPSPREGYYPDDDDRYGPQPDFGIHRDPPPGGGYGR